MNKLAIFLLVAVISSLCFSSCIKEEIRLTRYHRKLVDSLAQLQTSVLRDEMDSLCNIQLAEEVDYHTDSIVKVRLEEIQRKIQIEAYEQEH